MEAQGVPYDLIRFGHKSRLTDRFLTAQIHHIDLPNKTLVALILVEINSPWQPSGSFGAMLINQFIKEVNRTNYPSAITKLEQGLKAANQVITQAASRLSNEINAAIGLLDGAEIHLSTIGGAKVLLGQAGGRLTDVSGDPRDSRQTFSDLTSGELKDGECLVVANSTLARQLLNLPERTWQEKEGRALIEMIAQVERSPLMKNSGVVARYQPTKPTFVETIYWEDLEHRLPIRLPKMPKLALSQVNWSRFNRIVTVIQPPVLGLVRKLKLNRFKLNWRWPNIGPFPRRLVIPLLIIGLVTGGIWIAKARSGRSPNEPTKSQLNLVESIKAASREDRLPILSRISVEEYQSLGSSEQTEINQLAKELSLTLALLPASLFQVPAPIVGVETTGNRLLIIDQTGQLWRWENNALAKADQPNLIKSPLSLATLADNRLFVSDAVGNIWIFDDKPNQPTALPMNTALSNSPKLLAGFENNLYLYLINSKTVHRIGNFETEAANPPVYTKPETINLISLSDWAINGDVLGVSKTGEVRGWRRNQTSGVNFTVEVGDSLPRLTTNSKNTSLYLAFGKQLGKYSPEGKEQEKRLIMTAALITDISLSPDGTKLYLAIGDSVYQLTP